MRLVGIIVISFLLGGLPTGLLLGKVLAHKDIRQSGSGNIGATNALRTLGIGFGILTFAGDLLKGILAVFLARVIAPADPLGVALAMFFAVFGHCYSPFLGFSGGKGVATVCGVMMAVDPPLTLCWLGVFFIIVAVTRLVSLGSITTIFCAALYTLFFTTHPFVIKVALLLCASVSIFRHHENMRRLLNGSEKRLGADHAS